MSAPAEAPKAAAAEPAPESPTTARPLEMDDDDVQESGIGEAAAPKPAAATPPAAAAHSSEQGDAPESAPPPPKPPRPMTEQQKNEQMLQEAFPTVEPAVIKAVLTASRGQIEPAFNALLEMSDPDAVRHEQPPPQPPRPVPSAVGPTATPQSQLEADELYARQLADRYENDGAYEARTAAGRGGGGGGQGWPRGRQQTGLKPNEMYDRDRSFVDDDLPVIKENIKKGFQETQATFNRWFNTAKKQFDNTFNEPEDGEPSQGPRGGGGFMGRPNPHEARRSADYDRYDADPELLSDDFAGMKFNSDGTPARDRRPLANPNLFRPPPPSTSPKPADGRRVAFKDGVEDIDAYEASPKLPPKDNPPSSVAGGGAASAKQSKWQPLSSIDPNPIAETDPFSLGDSEDEEHKGGIKMEDSERLRAAAAEAMADSLVDDGKAKTDQAAAAGRKD